jgi:hypothetical protein
MSAPNVASPMPRPGKAPEKRLNHMFFSNLFEISPTESAA